MRIRTRVLRIGLGCDLCGVKTQVFMNACGLL